jgi:hypothetical protein
MKKAQRGVTQTKRFASKRSSSYPVEEKVEYDTTGYSSGKTMFPAKFTKTYSSGKTETNTGSGDRASVDKAIKEPVKYEGTKTQYTKLPAKGSDIRKYMNTRPAAPLKGPLKESSSSKPTQPKKKSDGYDDYMKTTRGESFKVSDATKKSSTPKKSVKRKKDEGIKVPERKMPELKVAAPLDKTLRTGPEKRKFSKGEIKIMEIMQKGKKKDGTMKEGAQRKIQAVRTKERLATQKIRNKAERAEKRYEVKSAKAKVKAVRKSFRK